jgi:hypothetical protein
MKVFAQTPYAGEQSRQIKELSEPQIGDLPARRGMELAPAAELNGITVRHTSLNSRGQLGFS